MITLSQVIAWLSKPKTWRLESAHERWAASDSETMKQWGELDSLLLGDAERLGGGGRGQRSRLGTALA